MTFGFRHRLYVAWDVLRYRLPDAWDSFWRNCWLNNLWYDLRCFFWYRYRTVHPTSLPGNGWVDRDALMLHCSFQCLVDFVEKEMSDAAKVDDPTLRGGKGTGDDSDLASLDPITRAEIEECNKTQNDNNQEILRLYRWWKNRYLKVLSGSSCLINENDEEIQAMFHCLVDVRQAMWT